MGVHGIIKFFTIRAVEGIVAVLLITFMPNLPPDAKYSQSYSLTPVLPFEGPLTLNDKLQSAEIWHKGDFLGPEGFAVYNDELYTTVHGGNVVKLIGDKIVPVVKFGKQCKGIYQEHICGRPLGMQFDKQGGLYVADAYYGIFKVDVKTGKQLQLVSMDQEINGKKPKLPNCVAVASNGDIYWTDSSTEFFLYDGVFDMLADGSGRLIHYDAKTKKNTVLIDKLHFANGVRLATDESFVITSETARCRVYRYYLQGPKKGTYDVFLDGLPGLPDNIQTDGKDGFLIPLVIGRDDDYPPPLNILGPFPLLRKFLSRVLGLTELGFKVIDQVYPCEWAERAIHYIGHFASIPHSFSSPRQTIMHISKGGIILDTIHSLNGSVIGMSDAFIFKDMLYMGSPFNDHAARIPLEKVGWGHLALKESDYPSSSSTATESANAKVVPESKTIPAPTQQPKVATQPTPKAATPSQPTTPPPQKVTKPTPTPQETSTQVPKVATPTPSQTSKQSPSPPPTKQTQPPPPIKETPSPVPAKQTAPPAPTKQTSPPPPVKQTAPPAPTKQTSSPPPSKQTPPPSPTKQSPPPPPAKQTSSPPPVKQTAPPDPTQQTPPPPPAKQTSPPPPVKQTAPPAPTKQTPSPTKQTPSPTKQTPPPPPAKQTQSPPPAKETQPPSPVKQTQPPPPQTAQTSPPPPTKQTQPPPPPTTRTSPPPSTQPPKATTPTEVPKVDTYTSTSPSQQLPSPSVKQVPTKPSAKEESSQTQGAKASTTAKEPSTQSTTPPTDPPKVSTTQTTQNKATPKQAPQPVGQKNEL